jgi:hypothetical protein
MGSHIQMRGNTMHKTLAALALAATIAVAGVALPQTAEARGGHGGAVAAGIIGGLAAGAIIGSAAANNGDGGYYYGPGPYAYQPEPVYVAPRRYYRGGGGGCWHVTDSDRGYGYYGSCY